MNNPENPTTNDTPWWENDPDAARQAFGIVFHKVGNTWTVHRTLVGSPAERSGVRQQDVIDMIDGTALQSDLRLTKLNAMIELLDTDIDHEVAFLRDGHRINIRMRPRILRELIAKDAAERGTDSDYCYSCPSCYSRPSGAASCSDCPQQNCTIG